MPADHPEDEAFVMSSANLKKTLQDEIFEVVENYCHASDESESDVDNVYDLEYKTFGQMITSDLSREFT